MIQERKDAKAAEAAKREAEEEEARLKAEEEAEEALRWLTHEELRTGNYDRYIAAGSRQGEIDEKNKEMLLTDVEFEKVGREHCTADLSLVVQLFKGSQGRSKHIYSTFRLQVSSVYSSDTTA